MGFAIQQKSWPGALLMGIPCYKDNKINSMEVFPLNGHWYDYLFYRFTLFFVYYYYYIYICLYTQCLTIRMYCNTYDEHTVMPVQNGPNSKSSNLMCKRIIIDRNSISIPTHSTISKTKRKDLCYKKLFNRYNNSKLKAIVVKHNNAITITYY